MRNAGIEQKKTEAVCCPPNQLVVVCRKAFNEKSCVIQPSVYAETMRVGSLLQLHQSKAALGTLRSAYRVLRGKILFYPLYNNLDWGTQNTEHIHQRQKSPGGHMSMSSNSKNMAACCLKLIIGGFSIKRSAKNLLINGFNFFYLWGHASNPAEK